ncbi:helix-turn-helix domain-containing protein [Roseburia faecis]|uniref:helix-turn-helix domain-containing protein n=1 Tax=Roseburia faecis TaxID=301302 RepID=UPI003F9A07DC
MPILFQISRCFITYPSFPVLFYVDYILTLVTLIDKIYRVTPSTLSNYEHGYRVPSLEKLVSLAMYYHCTTDYLLGVTQEGQQLLDTGKLSTQQLSLLNTFLQSL